MNKRTWVLGLGSWGKAFLAVSCLSGSVVAVALAQDPGPRTQDPVTQDPVFIEIPGGPFTMGADRSTDPAAFDNEKWSSDAGEGTVDLPAFYLARHEVTVAEFSRFAQAGKWNVDPRALSGAPDHPVAFVSWPDAIAYARWLEADLKSSASTPPHIAQALRDGWRVSLPTEAQWEKAARGADRRRFPWGSEPRRDRANFSSAGTVPAGRIACPECAHGLSDMAGNVWEWTRSPYQPYPYDPADDRTALDKDALWVMRGGGFADGPQLIRTTARGAAEPGARRPFIGFRVAISPK
jgi:formylglycine-generating enzyme required for sulfatase activity